MKVEHKEPTGLPPNSKSLSLSYHEEEVQKAVERGEASVKRNLRAWPHGKELLNRFNSETREIELFWSGQVPEPAATRRSPSERARLGKKYLCSPCQVKYYDMNDPDKLCPKCSKRGGLIEHAADIPSLDAAPTAPEEVRKAVQNVAGKMFMGNGAPLPIRAVDCSLKTAKEQGADDYSLVGCVPLFLNYKGEVNGFDGPLKGRDFIQLGRRPGRMGSVGINIPVDEFENFILYFTKLAEVIKEQLPALHKVMEESRAEAAEAAEAAADEDEEED